MTKKVMLVFLLVVDIEYPKTLRMLHNDLPFLHDRMKVNKVIKLVCNVTEKTIKFILLH